MEKDELVYVGKYALLDEHELSASPSRKGVKVDAARLQRIADNGNKRAEELQSPTPSVIGHTDEDLPEKHQPEIVGYWKDFTVEPLFNTGRKALWGKHYVYKSKLSEARKYPRRSVEFWSNRDEIDPVSLLGATTPERDLGLMLFSKEDEKPYHYNSPTEEEKEPEMAKEQPAMEEIVAAVMQSAPMKQMMATTEKLMQLVEALEQEDQAQPDPNDQPAAPEEAAQPEEKPDDKEAAKDNNPPPVKFEAASAPSATNVTIPNTMDKKKNYEMDEELKIKFSRIEEENAKLRNEVAEQKSIYQRDNAKNLLEKAKVAKIVFDYNEEYGLMEDMPVDIQAKHYARMDKFYAKESTSPVEANKTLTEAIKFSREGNGKSGPEGIDEVTQAAEQARKNNMSYSDYVKNHYNGK